MRHRLVQGVHDKHGGHGDTRCGLEVFCVKVKSTLADNHEAEGRDEGGG